MAILDKFYKIIPRIKTATGYVQYVFRAKDVRMEDNTDLETKIIDMDSKITNIPNKNLHFYAFTLVTKPSGSSVKITTLSKMKELFGENVNVRNCGAIVMNGDGTANTTHVEGVTWQSSVLYAIFNQNTSANIRITGLIYYYDGDILENAALS